MARTANVPSLRSTSTAPPPCLPVAPRTAMIFLVIMVRVSVRIYEECVGLTTNCSTPPGAPFIPTNLPRNKAPEAAPSGATSAVVADKRILLRQMSNSEIAVKCLCVDGNRYLFQERESKQAPGLHSVPKNSWNQPRQRVGLRCRTCLNLGKQTEEKLFCTS
jgi:hypothetical protein